MVAIFCEILEITLRCHSAINILSLFVCIFFLHPIQLRFDLWCVIYVWPHLIHSCACIYQDIIYANVYWCYFVEGISASFLWIVNQSSDEVLLRRHTNKEVFFLFINKHFSFLQCLLAVALNSMWNIHFNFISFLRITSISIYLCVVMLSVILTFIYLYFILCIVKG